MDAEWGGALQARWREIHDDELKLALDLGPDA
jgi:hypothetical protein